MVVLNEGDKLSKEAQHALRRTMEKYIGSCRLIINCKNLSKMIEPVRSRCLAIRIPAPDIKEIGNALKSVAQQEKVEVPELLIERIAQSSERNLRKALLILEATKSKHYPFSTSNPSQIPLEKPDWEIFIAQIAREIVEEQSPKKLAVVRSKLFELLSHCIPSELILKHLTLELLKKLDAELKCDVVQWAAFYVFFSFLLFLTLFQEHRIQLGTKGKAIFHLEAFVAKFMSTYKKFEF